MPLQYFSINFEIKSVSMFSKKNVNQYLNFLKNKYILTSILFAIWVLVFDQNNLLDRKKYVNEYKQLLNKVKLGSEIVRNVK